MKKALFTIAVAIAFAISAKAENDTTKVVAHDVDFYIEVYTNGKGDSKTDVVCVVDGVEFPSNKTSMERYKAIKRWGGEPCLVFISNSRRKTRVAVL